MKRLTLSACLLLMSAVSARSAVDRSEKMQSSYDQLISAGGQEAAPAVVPAAPGYSEIKCVFNSDCPRGLYCRVNYCEEIQGQLAQAEPPPNDRRCVFPSDCPPGYYCRAFRCEWPEAP